MLVLYAGWSQHWTLDIHRHAAVRNKVRPSTKCSLLIYCLCWRNAGELHTTSLADGYCTGQHAVPHCSHSVDTSPAVWVVAGLNQVVAAVSCSGTLCGQVPAELMLVQRGTAAVS